MACLYQIEFPNGKSYIGITIATARRRFDEHAYKASRQSIGLIHKALRKYGIESVTLRTLAIGSWDYLCDLERAAIKAYGTFGIGGYNMTAGGDGALGYKHTAESLKIMGAVHKGKAHHSMPHSDATKAMMSANRKGKKKPPRTAEHRANLSACQKGILRGPMSEECKAKISRANKGNKWTPEARANMSLVASAREAKKKAAKGPS